MTNLAANWFVLKGVSIPSWWETNVGGAVPRRVVWRKNLVEAVLRLPAAHLRHSTAPCPEVQGFLQHTAFPCCAAPSSKLIFQKMPNYVEGITVSMLFLKRCSLEVTFPLQSSPTAVPLVFTALFLRIFFLIPPSVSERSGICQDTPCKFISFYSLSQVLSLIKDSFLFYLFKD